MFLSDFFLKKYTFNVLRYTRYYLHLFIESTAKNVSGGAGDDFVVPLLMKNAVPEGFETDDKLDVSIRPDEVDLYTNNMC